MKQLPIFLLLLLQSAMAQTTVDCKHLLEQADAVYYSDHDSAFHLSLKAQTLAELVDDILVLGIRI